MKTIRVFYLNIFQFLEVKFSIYLNRRVFVMIYTVYPSVIVFRLKLLLAKPDVFKFRDV